MLAAGHVIGGRYHIERLVGRGGMGEVYRARDEHLGAVAIKRMMLPFGSPRERAQGEAQFRQEAQLLLGLDHPNLVKVHAFLEEDGEQLIVLEFIEGPTLYEVALDENRPLPMSEVMAWTRAVADVLTYLHGRSPPILVRDLKPGNLMLDPSGTVRLIDFGLARQRHHGSHTLSVVRGAGTAGYAPVEQQRGRSDERADLYALGATMYTLITRDPPPDAVALYIGEQTLAPPSFHRDEVPSALDTLVLKLMDPRPEQRVQSIGEVQRALTRLARDPRKCPLCSRPLRKGLCATCLPAHASALLRPILKPLPSLSPPPEPQTWVPSANSLDVDAYFEGLCSALSQASFPYPMESRRRGESEVRLKMPPPFFCSVGVSPRGRQIYITVTVVGEAPYERLRARREALEADLGPMEWTERGVVKLDLHTDPTDRNRWTECHRYTVSMLRRVCERFSRDSA